MKETDAVVAKKIYLYIHTEDDRLMELSIYLKIAQLQPWIKLQRRGSTVPATQNISIQSSKMPIDKGSFAHAYRPCIGRSGWLGQDDVDQSSWAGCQASHYVADDIEKHIVSLRLSDGAKLCRSLSFILAARKPAGLEKWNISPSRHPSTARQLNSVFFIRELEAVSSREDHAKRGNSHEGLKIWWLWEEFELMSVRELEEKGSFGWWWQDSSHRAIAACEMPWLSSDGWLCVVS